MSAHFDPQTVEAKKRYKKAARMDGRPGNYAPYQYAKTYLPVAVNAALSTRRPLLLRGDPGAGKSSLAYDVAVVLGWTYYERVVSSRMTANDLLWYSDAIERLNDASSKEPSRLLPASEYLRPQVLWWVLDPASAHRVRPNDVDPYRVAGDAGQTGAVLLLDEIDKADPDLANDLLIPIGEGRFRVPDLGDKGNITRTRDYLIIVTTNGERELPAPFLRRCIVQELTTPEPPDVLEIAKAHRSELADPALLTSAKALIQQMFDIRNACKSGQHKPGTAEILDALHASLDLGINENHADWKALLFAMGWKNAGSPPGAKAGK